MRRNEAEADMAVRVFRAAERAATPWKNGGGVTREIAVGPSGAGLEDFAWRVSLAEIARDGAFSAFAGVERVITVVDGLGMVLTVDGTPYAMAEPYVPLSFPGDAVTDCRLLDGPVVDLNVMTRPDLATAHIRVVRDRCAVRPPGGTMVLVIALAGTVVVEAPAPVTLQRYDAALLSDTDAGTVRPDGVAALVTLTAASDGGP